MTRPASRGDGLRARPPSPLLASLPPPLSLSHVIPPSAPALPTPGLLPILKELIEILFQEGLLKVGQQPPCWRVGQWVTPEHTGYAY